MTMNYKDKEKIKKRAYFLSKEGFKSVENDYGIDYLDNRVKISIYYERYGTAGLIGIHFVKENAFFDIGWIALVRENIQAVSDNSLENILILLRFVEKNFDQIINYQYCEESSRLIDQYCAKLLENDSNNNQLNKEEIQKLINCGRGEKLS